MRPKRLFFPLKVSLSSRALLHQLHHARLLQNEMPVVVKLVRPETTAQLLCDLELLERW